MAVSFSKESGISKPGTLKAGSLAALAAGLALASLPGAALAQEAGRRWQGGVVPEEGSFHRPDRANRGGNRGWQAERGEQPAQAGQRIRTERPALPYRSEQRQQAQAGWLAGNAEGRPGARTRGDGAGGTGWSNQARTETRSTGPGWDGSRQVAPEPVLDDRQTTRAGRSDENRNRETWRGAVGRQQEGWRNDGRGDDRRRAGEGWRGSDDRRRETWRQDDGRREAWRDEDRRRDGYRDGHRDWNRYWNRDWRRDNRYDWYSYRAKHRNHYRLGPYYAPYRHYSYRRLSIGFYLDSLFFTTRYWIADPWVYRLPPAYGRYRWIRYYDDVLLVDIRTGEVIDVIYDFFW